MSAPAPARQPPVLGLLHTVPGLAATFTDLVTRASPGACLLHVVDPGLLAAAIAAGVGADVTGRVAGHVDHLLGCGARGVLVTCSSIGEAAEAAAIGRGAPVLRVDAPMAARAAALATAPGARGRIAVLATLAATLGPTGRLVDRAVREVGAGPSAVRVVAEVVDGAAAARSAGDLATHDRLVAAAVGRVAAESDVVVLAQASMADAAAGAGTDAVVLTSPVSGVEALLAAVGWPGVVPDVSKS